jgi:uncharacterized protein YgiM (DUF1202 family)
LTNAEKIWNFLIKNYENPYGVAGLMGNLYAESGLNPKNLQNTYEKKLGMTDEEYTSAVDAGTYANFAKDSAGYGLAQWTYSARKLNLLTYVKNKKVSIGDLEAQLEFLVKELAGYTAVIKAIKEAKSVKEASDVILTKYERPADQSESTKNKRASYGQKYYDQFAKKEEKQMADYSKYINSTGTHYISNSGSDERGKYHSGSAGDQTGKEWQLRSWYNRPWTHVFRYEKDPRVGQTLCNLGCAAALNNNIGYDQYQRATYWAQLQKVGYNPAKITVKCEEDCSAGVAANVKATGYLLGIKALQDVSSSMTSRNTVTQLEKAGFTVLTESKYLTSGKYLRPGDILLCENHHVAMNVTNGAKAKESVEEFNIIDTAIANTTMFVRTEPDVDSKHYGTVSKGSKVSVIEILENDWLKIKYSKSPSGYGYTSNSNGMYYTLSNPMDSYITTGTVNIRKNAGKTEKIIIACPKGQKLLSTGVHKEINGTPWYEITTKIKNKNYRGYVSSLYVKKV